MTVEFAAYAIIALLFAGAWIADRRRPRGWLGFDVVNAYVYLIWQVVIWLVTTAISASQMKVPKGGPAAGADKFQFPTASEDRTIPIILGPGWAKGPNLVWRGNLTSRAVKQSGGRKYAFFGPKRYTIINYIYSIGMHLIPLYRADKVLALKIGEKVLAEGLDITTNTTLNINKPDLFGGDKAGGGFVGNIDIEFGGPTQGVNPYLASKITGRPVSAHRGVFGLVLNDCAITAAPPGQGAQVQPIAVRVLAATSMCSWYPEKIITPSGGINPAHALRIVCTRQPWNNSAYEDSDIDDASWTALADLLYDEDFGMAAKISDDGITADNCIDEILRTIDATLYEVKSGASAGKLKVKANRADYVADSLLLVDNSIVLSVEEFTRTGWGERFNRITCSYYNLEADKDRSAGPFSDPAAISKQGGIVARTMRYAWVFQPEIADRLGERDLLQYSADLAVATLVCNRRASHLQPGDVFRWSDPDYGIVEVVMRVKRVDYGSLADGRVRITCVQDIFSLPQAVYDTPAPSGGGQLVNDPQVATARAVMEAPFWLTGPGAFDPVTDGTLLALAGPPTSDALDFEFWAGTPYADVLGEPGAFSEYADTTAVIGRESPTSTVPVTAGITSASVGKLAAWGAEIVRIDAVGASLTVSRGMLDTVPAEHGSGTRIIVFEDNLAVEPFANGAAVNVKLLPSTLRGRLALADAPADVVNMNQRHYRPYPPGNFKINGTAYPAAATGALTATWARRNRLTQLSEPLVDQDDGDISPEAGTTFTVRWYSAPSTLLSTETGITGTSSTPYMPPGAGDYRCTIEAIRDGIGSWQLQDHTFSWTP